MRIPRRPIVALVATLLLGLRVAAADDPPPKEPKTPKADAGKGPAKGAEKASEQIDWRPQWTEAVEEAAERGILILLHSHGST